MRTTTSTTIRRRPSRRLAFAITTLVVALCIGIALSANRTATDSRGPQQSDKRNTLTEMSGRTPVASADTAGSVDAGDPLAVLTDPTPVISAEIRATPGDPFDVMTDLTPAISDVLNG